MRRAERAFESFDVPKGTLRGSPPVPEDDLTTLRTSLYLVAHKKLGTDLVTSLTQAIMSARRNLLREQPIFAQITAPSTDQDAYLPLHPGAAAVYNSTTQSFMDEYGNWIYLTPMVLGGAATMLAAAWKFLGIGKRATEGPLDSLYALARRIRKVDTEAELSDIEEEIDGILKAERAKSAAGDESAVDDATLNVAAHRLESLIHDRRTMMAKDPQLPPRPKRQPTEKNHETSRYLCTAGRREPHCIEHDGRKRRCLRCAASFGQAGVTAGGAAVVVRHPVVRPAVVVVHPRHVVVHRRVY